MKAVTTTWKPREDQQAAVDWAVNREAAGIFAKPGVGKTAITLEVLRQLRLAGEAQSMVIVAPLRPMYSTWPAEVLKWHYGYSVGICHGSHKLRTLREKHDIYLVNPEGVPWLTDMIAEGELPKWIDTLVVDESTKFKNPQAKRFKALRGVLARFKNRYILTGTPQTRSLEDLWSQVLLLDGGKRLGQYITHFRRKFMVDAAPPRAQYSDWQPIVGAEDMVYQIIGDICLTVPSPRTTEPLFNMVGVPLGRDARAQYDQMERQYFMDLDMGVITAANAGVKSMKLRQITGGFVYDDARDPQLIHTEKLEAMVDFIEELGNEPLLIAVNFDHEAQAVQAWIKRYFGLVVPYFGGGGLKGKEAALAIEAWNAGQTRVLVANPQSAAHGLNLQHGGSNCLWYSLTYNWEDWEQFNKRLDRVGQKNTVVISVLLADNTIDHDILAVLQGRGKADSTLFNLMGARRNERQKAA